MTSRSSFDSKIGLTICSPHCIARFGATREPLHSNWVATGSRYMSSLRPALTRERGPGGRMRIGDHQQFERLQALQRFGHARDAVAGVPLHEHRPHIVLLRDLVLRQHGGVEPARERDAGRLHDLLVVEAAEQEVVVDLPDARPMLPGAFGEAVVERQRHDIEADVGGALHVVVAAQDVGAGARSRRRCRSSAARCSSPARWRCRPSAGSGPCTRSASPASPSRTSSRRA